MSVPQSRPASDVMQAVQTLWPVLEPCCERLEIAGSLRRGRSFCKDGEIVCVPKMVPDPTALFDGKPVSAVVLLLDRLLAEGAIEIRTKEDGSRLAWGERERCFTFQGVAIDVFSCVGNDQWGLKFLLRTGPYEFSKWIVTSRFDGGAMPPGMRSYQGAIWDGARKEGDKLIGGRMVPTPEEIDVFNVLGIDYIEPGERQPMWRRG